MAKSGFSGKGMIVAAMAAMLAATAVPLATVPAQARGPESVADLAEGLLESVVNISTSQNVQVPQSRDPRRNAPTPPGGSPFQDYFDEFFDDGEQQGESPERPGNRARRVNSLGSGFVIDAKEGIIVTNNHVIADADEITINFSDGDSLEATLVGRDQKTDLAVLKVDPSKKALKAVPFGDSEKARIGDWVMAIGNPFGLGGTVTVGIISAQNRNINSGPYDRFIQTDAAINRGNSGGPLFNMAGEVIGINTAIISPSGGSIGIGFSIPSELAAGVIDQLRKYGETRRGFLGVRIQPVTDDIAEGLGMTKAKGVLISSIIAGGPADGGVLKPGDVVLKFHGKDVNEPRELSRAVAESPVGEAVKVTILRDGKEEEVEITLGRLETGEEQMAAAADGGDEATTEEPVVEIHGMTLGELDDAARAQFGIDEAVTGVLVSAIADGSQAAEKGLTPGTVIVEIAQEAVNTIEDVQQKFEALTEQGRKNALLMVAAPSGELSFVTIRID